MARDPRDDALLLFDMMEMLLRQKLYHSAEIVGGILLSRASIPSQEPEEGLHAEALSMFAEVLSAKGEHRRATVRIDLPCCAAIYRAGSIDGSFRMICAAEHEYHQRNMCAIVWTDPWPVPVRCDQTP